MAWGNKAVAAAVETKRQVTALKPGLDDERRHQNVSVVDCVEEERD